MQIYDEHTVTIEGEEYWTVVQFAKLTGRKEGAIRVMANKGNRLRKLKTKSLAGRLFILASELFDFPFVICGRPAMMGDYVERFYLEDGELMTKEEVFEKCQ